MGNEVCMEAILIIMWDKPISKEPQIIEKDIPFVLDAYFIIRNIINYIKLWN